MEENIQGLENVNTFDTIMGIVYGLTAVILLTLAYIVYTRKFRRRKLEAINQIEFITARYDIYSAKAQFLLVVPQETKITLSILDAREVEIEKLIDDTLNKGEHVLDFLPEKYGNGIYYLKLNADHVDILRKIKIENQK